MQLLVAFLSCIFGLFILVLSGTTLCNFSPIQRFVFCTQNRTHFPGRLLLYSIRLVQYRLQSKHQARHTTRTTNFNRTRYFQDMSMCIGKFHFTFAGFKVEIGAQTIMSNQDWKISKTEQTRRLYRDIGAKESVFTFEKYRTKSFC